MSFGEVETLFHEFGHGLQGMLTVVDEADVSGLSGIEWDAVEIASQFMENWCLHEPTLRGMTKHVETGEPLPHALFAKLKAAKTFRAGSMFARQLIFGQTDMKLHGDYDPKTDGTPFEVFRGINDSLSPLPSLPDDRFLCAFTHIFAGGYSAGYYSYKWSEVLSADAFSAFEEAGLDNEAAVQSWGRKIRDTLFALGGSEDPQVVYRAFRGRDPSTEALLRHNGLLKA
jgi:oligopeptidase A